jgi:hypothetical protein
MITLSEAIYKKYYENYCTKSDQSLTFFLPKFRNIRVPKAVVLSEQSIKTAGNAMSLRKYCKNIQHLDLSKNNLTNWKEIVKILQEARRLEELNISFNNLRYTSPYTLKQFPTLKCLVLNGTHLQWKMIGQLLEMLPLLEELHLSSNEYKKVPIDVARESVPHEKGCCPCHCIDNNKEIIYNLKKSHTKLKTLYFRKNSVEQWKYICQLGRIFPSLETLILSECHLTDIECSVNFPKLKCLNLNDIKCVSWKNIVRLTEFPNLTNVHVRRWPLWIECGLTKQLIWQLLIRLLPMVEQLNSSFITKKDRDEAHHMSIDENHVQYLLSN